MENKTEIPKRKKIRLEKYDYSSVGAYFITICIKERKRILSDIVKYEPKSSADPTFNDTDPQRIPHIQLTEIGKIIEKNLVSSENMPGVIIDRYVIMPDHIHVILFLKPPRNKNELNEPDNKNKISCQSIAPYNKTLPRVIAVFKRICNKAVGDDLFQRGYFEHIIRGREDYEEHLKYMYENPIRWYYDKGYAKE